MENKQDNEQEIIKEAASKMVDVMQKDDDPKFQQSKFLEFLRNIEKGALKIENNRVEVVKYK